MLSLEASSSGCLKEDDPEMNLPSRRPTAKCVTSYDNYDLLWFAFTHTPSNTTNRGPFISMEGAYDDTHQAHRGQRSNIEARRRWQAGHQLGQGPGGIWYLGQPRDRQALRHHAEGHEDPAAHD